jgi:hypothetical protein
MTITLLFDSEGKITSTEPDKQTYQFNPTSPCLNTTQNILNLNEKNQICVLIS